MDIKLCRTAISHDKSKWTGVIVVSQPFVPPGACACPLSACIAVCPVSYIAARTSSSSSSLRRGGQGRGAHACSKELYIRMAGPCCGQARRPARPPRLRRRRPGPLQAAWDRRQSSKLKIPRRLETRLLRMSATHASGCQANQRLRSLTFRQHAVHRAPILRQSLFHFRTSRCPKISGDLSGA